MKFDFTQREDVYRKASPVVRELYGGDIGTALLQKVFSHYHLRAESYLEYSLAFSDVVLGLEREEDLPALLVERVGLPEKLAVLIAHDLLEYIYEYKASVEKPPAEEIPVAEKEIEIPAPLETIPAETFLEEVPPQAEVVPEEIPAPQTSPSTPAWSTTPEEPEPQEVVPTEPDISNTPSYAKPYITSTPRYGNDPYREKL